MKRFEVRYKSGNTNCIKRFHTMRVAFAYMISVEGRISKSHKSPNRAKGAFTLKEGEYLYL